MSEAEVLTRIEGGVGILSLNRPRAIHALNLNMVRMMVDALMAWRDDPAVRAVMIDHAVDPEGDPKLSRGFCSGGDIAMLRASALSDGGRAGRAFFFAEYQLNHLLFTYPKPAAAFMDGITMGGGVGISSPAPYRVATARTRYAMPESGIGLFPDVGGGWFLSRMAGRLGQYLALTGGRLDGAECVWAGIATHYLDAGDLAQAKARIIAGEDMGAVLDAFHRAPPVAGLSAHADDIARLFAGDDLESILDALARDSGEFAGATLATINSKSPTTCKVALHQLATGAAMPDFAANMAQEYRIAARVLMLSDFAEGVRAVIIDKDNAPQWSPPRAQDVTQAMVEAIFAPLPEDEEWKSL